ncbi:hypothetical protein B0H19DRAFT_1104323 [Mycena capillaripes]|nr:hypothetical protein B0H19DRAFT_1104323 [Mycena capillaripes]
MQQVSTLPLDLERLIFELAALSRPVCIPNLMRVAFRVRDWVEPLLYHTLLIGVDPIDGLPVCDIETFTLIARTKPQSLLHSVVNVMATGLEAKEAKNIISACPRIENLFMMVIENLFSSGESAPPGFDNLPLKQLYCSLSRISDPTSLETLDRPPFSHLTHLELFDGLHDFDDSDEESVPRWTKLAALPNLTHLALNTTRDGVCVHLLAICRCLVALVLLRRPDAHKSAEMDLLVDDPRFVMMPVDHYIADWQLGLLTGSDYWARADAHIAKRLSGEIDRRIFYLDLES